MRLLVSACLLGVCCRYDGQAKPDERVLSLLKEHILVPVCPEQLGGLPTPRCPCEILDGRVTAKDGIDRTAEYRKGAAEALRLARLFACEAAVLKARSPSCGAGQVYDGAFTGTLRAGNGVTAGLLIQNDIPVYTEENLPEDFAEEAFAACYPETTGS